MLITNHESDRYQIQVGLPAAARAAVLLPVSTNPDGDLRRLKHWRWDARGERPYPRDARKHSYGEMPILTGMRRSHPAKSWV
jgi:hypothetical protein